MIVIDFVMVMVIVIHFVMVIVIVIVIDVVAVDDVHFADDGDPVDSLGVHFPRREQIRFSDFEEGSKTRRRRRGRCCRFGRVS